MPNAAVNHSEFAAFSIRRPYHSSISALARGENRRTIESAAITSGGFGVSLAVSARATASAGSVLRTVQTSRYCRAVSASAIRWPTLVCPKKPDAVKFVDPVQTSTGSFPFFSRTMNLLCGILVLDLRNVTF